MFHVSRIVDLTHREAEEKSRGHRQRGGPTHRVAYACSSPRTDLDVLGEFAQQLDYQLMTFDAQDSAGRAIYHTNVLMAIGSAFAVVCGESIVKPDHRHAVFSRLLSTGHEILDISRAQMDSFAGTSWSWQRRGDPHRTVGDRLGELESAAAQAGGSRHTDFRVDPTIERLGGGGVRCMLAEIHLPKRA